MRIEIDGYETAATLRIIARAIYALAEQQQPADGPVTDPDLAADYKDQSEPAAKSVIVEVEIPVKSLLEQVEDAASAPVDARTFFGGNAEGYAVGDPHPTVPVAPVATVVTGLSGLVPIIPTQGVLAAFAPTAPVGTALTASPTSPVPTIVPIVPERDTAGLPWDARIHSASRAKNHDGTWRAKRGLDKTPGLEAQVVAEIRQVLGLPVPVVAVPAPAETAARLQATSPTPINVFVAAPAAPPVVAAPPPPPPAPPAPPPPPAAPAGAPPITFGAMMESLTKAFAAGTVTQDQALKEMDAMGIPNFPLLMSRPDLIPVLAAKLGLPTTMSA